MSVPGQDSAAVVRQRIMATFAERPDEQLTVPFLSDELGEPFNRVAYNVRVLERDGELEAVEDGPDRVGVAYRLSR